MKGKEVTLAFVLFLLCFFKSCNSSAKVILLFYIYYLKERIIKKLAVCVCVNLSCNIVMYQLECIRTIASTPYSPLLTLYPLWKRPCKKINYQHCIN